MSKSPEDFDATRFNLDSESQVCLFAGVASLQNWLKHGMPRVKISKPGAKRDDYTYNAAEIFRWYVHHGPGAKRRGGQDGSPGEKQKIITFDEKDEEAALLSGPPTAALERLRTAKAQLAEIDVEERRKQSVPLSDLSADLVMIAGPLQRCGAELGRRFGPEAQKLLNDTLAEYLDSVRKKLARQTSTSETVSDRNGDVVCNVADSPPDQPMGGGGNLDSLGGTDGEIQTQQPPSEPDLVQRTGQTPLVEDSGNSPDPVRKDGDGVCDSGLVPSV